MELSRWRCGVLMAVAVMAFCGGLRVDAVAADRPNIVFMLSDDQSWNGTSVAMHPELEGSYDERVDTPSLERLAQEGMRFSQAYAPAPVCAPTRISLMTGRTPAALKWTKAGPSTDAQRYNTKLVAPRNVRPISTSATTFAELLQEAGYATAHFGKWHIDGGGPEQHGFDVSDGNLGNEAAAKFKDPNPVDIFGMAGRAEQFMMDAQSSDKPFYVQLSWHALHAPGNALKSTIAKYEAAGVGRDRQVQRAAITEDLDTGVGRVLDALDRLGLSENTYVIYMSDNGGGGSRQGELSGGKGSLGEGGIRVPLIVRGPGVEAGSWCHSRVVGYDFYPTFLEWAGVDAVPADVAKQLEGGSLAGLLRGKTQAVKRSSDDMVFHFPHYQSGGTPHSAIYSNEYKLIKHYETGQLALFNIDQDPGERNDLTDSHRDIALTLEKRLDTYLKTVDAQMPLPNERYDPDQPTTEMERKPPGASRDKRRKSR